MSYGGVQEYCKPLGVHCTVAHVALDSVAKNHPEVMATIAASDLWCKIQPQHARLVMRPGGQFLQTNKTRKVMVHKMSMLFAEVLVFQSCWALGVQPLFMRAYQPNTMECMRWDWGWFANWSWKSPTQVIELWTKLVSTGGNIGGHVPVLLTLLRSGDDREVDCYHGRNIVVRYVVDNRYQRPKKRALT